MKRLTILVSLVFLLALFTLQVSATEYDDPIVWFYNSAFGDPVQGIHDCISTGEHCYSAVYNDATNNVDFFYTPNNPPIYNYWCPQYPFGACSRSPTHTLSATFDYSRTLSLGNMTDYNNFKLPFGIVYSPSNNKYYAWIKTKVWEMPIVSTSTPTLVKDLSSFKCRSFAGQGEDSNGNPILLYINGEGGGSAFIYYPHNDTLVGISNVDFTPVENPDPASCSLGTGIHWVRWFFDKSNYNESIHVLYNYTRTGASPFFSVNLASKNDGWTDDWNYSHYWEDGIIYGAREGYSTDGIYMMQTNDFISYSTPELYYAYNKSNYDEDINTSWGIRTADKIFYQFDRHRNTTSSDINLGWGEMFNYDNLTNINLVSAVIENDCRHGYEFCPLTPFPVSARIECNDVNYTSGTLTGDNLNFYVPCTENMTIVTDSLDTIPSHSEISVDIESDCQDNTNQFNLWFRSPYDLSIRAIDEITYEGIPNVTMLLLGNTEITDSNGVAVFNVNPYSSANMRIVSSGSCNYLYWVNESGVFRNFGLTSTSAEYATQFDSFVLDDFSTTKDILLQPKGVNVVVRIRREDGREIEPDGSGVVNITGANKTYWYTYQKVISNLADQYPARFLLVDNRTSFNVTLKFSFAGTDYTTFSYNNQDYTTFEVFQNNTYTFWFTVPASDQPCEQNTDCLGSYCDSNTYFTSLGCMNNVCEYSPIECNFFCDDAVGCYKTKTTRTCDTSFDCDSTCTGNYTSSVGLCASDGFCVTETKTCKSPCENFIIPTVEGNKTVGVCPEVYSCYVLGSVPESFQLDVLYISGAESRPIDTTFRCSLSTAGTSECISGTTIATTSIARTSSSPVTWEYHIDGSNTVYEDIAVTCTSNCNITYEFCEYGCNPSTKTCYSEPTSTAGGISNLISGFVKFWDALLPNIYYKAIVWMFISMLIAGGLEYAIGGIKGRGMGIIFGIALILLTLTGAFVGQMPFELIVIFTIISGFLVWRQWGNTTPNG